MIHGQNENINKEIETMKKSQAEILEVKKEKKMKRREPEVFMDKQNSGTLLYSLWESQKVKKLRKRQRTYLKTMAKTFLI